jgi:hypothetical protein
VVEHYDAHGDTEWACEGDDDCPSVATMPPCMNEYSHRWTTEGCGGCDSNPGVWSLGGTALRYIVRCIICGVRRVETCYGSERNPGECDRVSYKPGPVNEAEARAEVARQRRNRRARIRRALKKRSKK